jgi:hypothetical protein
LARHKPFRRDINASDGSLHSIRVLDFERQDLAHPLIRDGNHRWIALPNCTSADEPRPIGPTGYRRVVEKLTSQGAIDPKHGQQAGLCIAEPRRVH